jgi:hypothetical protein
MASPSEHGFEYPGMTRMGSVNVQPSKPIKDIGQIPSLVERPVVLLATATITDENIFANGLFQNVYILYKLFDAAGWTPILTVNDKPKSLDKIPEVLRTSRVVSVEDLVKQPLPVKAYIEIGMSIDPNVRRFLRMIGAKIYKLYLGNILNIDIETPVFYPAMNFSHHVIGEIDSVFVSPHYGQHAEYAQALNHVDPTKDPKIAPYVWDPCILTNEGKRSVTWRPRRPDEKETFVIMEPNISFQKTAFFSIMALEGWYRNHKDWNGQVVIVNGERLLSIPFFRDSILPTLDLFKDNKVVILGRRDMHTMMTEYPSAIFCLHQWNNEYNYMTLELLHAGFPVLHNAQSWASYGYSYVGNSISSFHSRLDFVRQRHAELLETYRSHARALLWTHSPYNPEVQNAWISLLCG